MAAASKFAGRQVEQPDVVDRAAIPGMDRRRFSRTAVTATAVVFSAEDHHGTYLVQNLSAGGALLIGRGSLLLGTEITLSVQMPGETLHSLSARVVRSGHTDTTGTRFGVAFIHLEADDEDAIHQALVGELERLQGGHDSMVMMIHEEGETRDTLAQDLRKLGHPSIAVSTSLDALWCLQRPGAKVKAVMIDPEIGEASGIDMLRYLAEHHPDVRLIVLASDDQPASSHTTLPKPWSEEQLREALGL